MICQALLTQTCPGRLLPFFQVKFLGDKFPTLDFFVELVDAGTITAFFFVQVKTTRQGYTKNNRLKVQVSREDMQRLASYPAPTYIMGIDYDQEVGYVVAVNANNPSSMASLATKYPLNCATLQLLWNEVRDFWNQHNVRLMKSAFFD